MRAAHAARPQACPGLLNAEKQRQQQQQQGAGRQAGKQQVQRLVAVLSPAPSLQPTNLAATALVAASARAQTRYREKKKQEAAAAEGEYHATAAELARLRLENSKLQVGW